MASAKFLEDALSTDVDESAVNAIVGSLENQLVTSTSVPVQSRNVNSNQSQTSFSSNCNVPKYNIDHGNLKEVRILRSQGSVLTQNPSVSYSFVQPHTMTSPNVKVTMPTYCNEQLNAMLPRSSGTNIGSNNDIYHQSLPNSMTNPHNTGYINKSMPMQHSMYTNQGSLNCHLGMQGNTVNLPISMTSGPLMASPVKSQPQNLMLSNQNMIMSGPSVMSNMHLTNMRGFSTGLTSHKSVAAVSPRVIGTPGPSSSAGISLQDIEGVPIQSTSHQGHLLLKTDNGQYQLLRVGPAPQGARFTPAIASSGEGTSSGTSTGSTVPLYSLSHTMPTASSAINVVSQKPPDNSKIKCRNFFANLLDLSKKEPKSVEQNVKILIQELIDGQVEPDQFCFRLEQLLRATPQPCLIGFLKKTLPVLRQALINKELYIEGINPPFYTGGPHIPPIQPYIVTPNTQLMYHRMSVPGPSGVVPMQNSSVPQKSFKTTFRSPNSTQVKPSREMDKKSPAPFTVTTFTDEKVAGDDDINDVAAMGGVNLAEESQRILGSTETIGSQIRSCKDEYLVPSDAMLARCQEVSAKHGLAEPSPEVAAMLSHALQEKMKNMIEKLAVIAQHRMDYVPKTDPRYEVTQDVKAQLKFLEELDRIDMRKHEESEREMLMKAAKTRSKHDDPELNKLKAKAKEVQRVEMEEVRQRDANLTALQAIGPRKSAKLNRTDCAGDNPGLAGTSGMQASRSAPARVRTKRVTQRDLLYLMEQDRESSRSMKLYKYHLM